MARDYYSVLGVPETASQEEIRTAYRRLVRLHHPDVNKDPGSVELIKEINIANETLSDPFHRRNYDRAIQVMRDEQARLAYEQRMRAASPAASTPPASRPTAASSPQPKSTASRPASSAPTYRTARSPRFSNRTVVVGLAAAILFAGAMDIRRELVDEPASTSTVVVGVPTSAPNTQVTPPTKLTPSGTLEPMKDGGRPAVDLP